ncbi:MAG: 50S ribosomal protein L11 methyltransferase, partial [Chitinophagaceae bacterium]
KEWEKNFSPMVVNDMCYVRATFHEPMPQYPIEIIIDPKMAFGTGHHQTTTMMMEYVLEMDISGKKVLDMGCGTGILAILAAKKGVAELVAIDYDPLSYDSTIENANLNHVPHIRAICGGKEAIPDEQFDVILANINRNILLDQIPRYAEVLRPGGEIYYSGFYESPDLDIIKDACLSVGMRYSGHKVMGEWTAACFKS